ncbi:MAG: hypothetical protein ACK55Z_28800 [bacterium]
MCWTDEPTQATERCCAAEAARDQERLQQASGHITIECGINPSAAVPSRLSCGEG